jgi:multidrug resistance efflux pump
MADGTHTLTVVASQSDLLNSTASVTFATDSQLASVTSNLTNKLAAANSTISTLSGSLSTANGNIAALQGNVDSANHTIDNLTYLAYFAIAVAAVGIIIGAYALRGRAPWKY